MCGEGTFKFDNTCTPIKVNFCNVDLPVGIKTRASSIYIKWNSPRVRKGVGADGGSS